mmetsp:Transcript_38780/g.107817  ORF Transcript_38780/g.107817 Transcript_38780/m.107817 type:complete len:247 (+) Transcript_38780:1602-2342(+)
MLGVAGAAVAPCAGVKGATAPCGPKSWRAPGSAGAAAPPGAGMGTGSLGTSRSPRLPEMSASRDSPLTSLLNFPLSLLLVLPLPFALLWPFSSFASSSSTNCHFIPLSSPFPSSPLPSPLSSLPFPLLPPFSALGSPLPAAVPAPFRSLLPLPTWPPLPCPLPPPLLSPFPSPLPSTMLSSLGSARSSARAPTSRERSQLCLVQMRVLSTRFLICCKVSDTAFPRFSRARPMTMSLSHCPSLWAPS